VDLFTELVKFSGLEEYVVPGGLFYEVVGDLSVFAPEDDALTEELQYFGNAFNLTVDEVKQDKLLLQEILRQYIAYGDVSGEYRGLFVTLDGSVWNWTDADPEDGMSRIALVPVGLQLEQPPIVMSVDDDLGTLSGCSRGRRISSVVRDATYVRLATRKYDKMARRRYVESRYPGGKY